MESTNLEQKALSIGVIANLIMALAGYYIYYITRSEALLLDGNFSLVAALVTIIAIYITSIKHNRSETFPFGLYIYESLFVFFKGLIMLGIIIMAFFQNGLKIVRYFQGNEIQKISYGPITYYTLAMVIICFAMAFYFNRSYTSSGNKSDILIVESKSLVIDGIMSLVIGIAFILMSFIPTNSPLAFFHSIGDSLLVIIVGSIFLNTPLQIIKNAFIELGGGSVQDPILKEEIIQLIKSNLNDSFSYENSYFSKTGSSHLAIIYLKANKDKLNLQHLRLQREKFETILKQKYNISDLEIIIN